MKKKLIQRGRHVVLPIVDDVVAEIHLRAQALPTIIFSDPDGGQSELRIEDQVILVHGWEERVLEGAKPGATWKPQALAPLLELLGTHVTDALADDTGRLSISFSCNLTLQIASTTGYEAWHFQYPRPGRPVGGKSKDFIGLSGAAGHLI